MQPPDTQTPSAAWTLRPPRRDAAWTWLRPRSEPLRRQPPPMRPRWGLTRWLILLSLAFCVALSSGCASRPARAPVVVQLPPPALPPALSEPCGAIAPVPDPLTVEALLRWALEQLEGRACEQSRADALVEAWG